MMEINQRRTSELIPYANNARTHTDQQIKQIAASIQEFGFTNPVLIDEKSGIIAGHGRVIAAEKLQLESVPCIELSGLTEAQKKAYIITDNRLALNAGWDDDLLKVELERLKELDFDLNLLGFDEDLADLLTSTDTVGLTDPDGIPDTPETPVSVVGDVWQLGKHRVMCGDSTQEKDVSLLMDGMKIDLIYSDPPYGVNYSDKNKMFNKLNKGNRIKTPIKNDDLHGEDLGIFWGNVFNLLSRFFNDYCSYYISSPCGDQFYFILKSFYENDLKIKQILVWNKNNNVLGRSDYNYKHELILFGWKDRHKFYGNGIYKTSVWDIPKPELSNLHPTMKPVALIENCVLNSSEKNHVVADMFGGSGSTLIASEKTGRVCYTMEIETHYVDVIVNRWQDFTGQQATHAETGKTFQESTDHAQR